MIELTDRKTQIFNSILGNLQKINFTEFFSQHNIRKSDYDKYFLTITVDEILSASSKLNTWLCRHQDQTYVFNGCFWEVVENHEFKKFLGTAAKLLGVPKVESKFYAFKDRLEKQFNSSAYVKGFESEVKKARINLLNGTFEVSELQHHFKNFNHDDLLKYQLDFKYNEDATCPLFINFLVRVIPDEDKQKLLAEYLAYVFVDSSDLKLEKALILYGTGANGKSVLYEIVRALLGKENITHYSLKDLTDDKGYYRAKLANSLLNYGSEINSLVNSDIFKSLASGESVSARLPYGQPFILKSYGKLIFNANELPKNTEKTDGFHRRFLIIPFEETIPKEEQDPELSKKIIESELP